MTYNITDTNFEDTLAKNDCLVIVDFYSDECGPCKQTKPIFETVAKLYNEKVLFLKMDMDKNSIIPKKIDIEYMPTFLFFRNHVQVDKIVGNPLLFEKMLLNRINLYK